MGRSQGYTGRYEGSAVRRQPSWERPPEPPRRQPRRRGRRAATRLLCSGLVFLLLFGSLRLWPEQSKGLRERLSAVLAGDTDFQAAFSAAGAALDAGEPISAVMGQLCVTVLRPGEEAEVPEEAPETMETGLFDSFAAEEPTEPETPDTPVDAAEGAPTLEMAWAAPLASYSVTSPFGWREDPITGEEAFHYGVDLAAPEGTAVTAFADGTVEYTGESAVYGNYLALRHPDGTRSFYAHCNTVCVTTGQTVAMGEKIAEVGATGRVTGPHLHLELSREGQRLDPAFYLEPA